MNAPCAGSCPAPPQGRRLAGIDAWRALLMLGGLVLHGSVWQEPRPLFAAIALISYSFRMGSFFAISGFLCGVSIMKRTPGRWLARRTVQIGLPTLFGLLVICPSIGWIIGMRPPEAHGPDALPFDWYHLWFLLALLAYSPVAVLVDWLQRRHRLIDRIDATMLTTRSLLPLMLVIAGVSFVLMVAAAMLVGAMAPARYLSMLSECRMIAGYLPLYLLGLLTARSPRLRALARSSWRSPLAIIACTAALYLGWYGLVAPTMALAERAWADQLVQLAGAALCPPAVFMLIFRSAATLRRTPPLLHRLCDASLTIYLIHMPLIVAINLMFATVAWSPYLEYAIAVTTAGLLSYAIHVLVVRRVPLLMLLVNGRHEDLMRRRRRAASQSMDEPRHHLAIGSADLHLRA